ncbi:MAG: DUF3368 domain-containing protein [Deltaproteobacteria bacterium]
MIVVADSTPLIYLARLGVLEVLASMFGEVVVPHVVWVEVVETRPDAPGVSAIRAAQWIRVSDRALGEVDLGLDPGETAAIQLAESLRADVLLIDERAGRAVALERGLTVRGTLGVLVQARRSGAIPALRPVLDALVDQGFRIMPRLVTEALRAVGE